MGVFRRLGTQSAWLAASWLSALLIVSACNRSAPTSPDHASTTTTTTTITLNPAMTIESLVPPPGSDVSIGQCGFFTPSTCTLSLRGTFKVTYDATVQQPVFTVSFLDAGGRDCLHDSPGDNKPLVANQPKTYTTSRFAFVTVNPLNGPYVCGSPVNTTSIRLQLSDRAVNGRVLMETVVSAAYRWNP